jgi:O-antigen/teichoic acid export membrane protein
MTKLLAAGRNGSQSLRRQRSRGRILGGIAAQGSQALGSLVLQVTAARLLGLEGLGFYAALFAVIVLATAISSGFVGDSLTVLDRSDREVRAGLQAWCAMIVPTAGLLAAAGAWAVGFLDLMAAAAFGAAVMAYMLEDILRRLLMATLHFWRIVVVDIVGMAGAIFTVGVFWLRADQLSLTHFLLALAIGQTLALLVAVAMLPRSERRLVRMRPAALRAVAEYGSWRAVQQMVRPTLLVLVRVLCLTLAGVLATGQLEAARIYVAPAMLIVSGVSSVLFASYAVKRDSPLTELIRMADRSVLGLIVGVAIVGAIAVLALPWLGPLLTGGEYDLQIPAIIGWVAYAVSVGAVTPYGSLAAVRGSQAAVLGIRVADSFLSLALAAALLALGGSVAWVPLALATGSLLGGLAIRQILLRRRARREASIGS